MSAYVFVVFFVILLLFMVYVYAQWRIKNSERYLGYICALKSGGIFISSHHQDNVYNISSRVQGQEPQNSNQDAYLSVDHITITNQLNKPNFDDAPPSYEEAMRIAASTSAEPEEPVVVVIPTRRTD